MTPFYNFYYSTILSYSKTNKKGAVFINLSEEIIGEIRNKGQSNTNKIRMSDFV